MLDPDRKCVKLKNCKAKTTVREPVNRPAAS